MVKWARTLQQAWASILQGCLEFAAGVENALS